MKSLTQSIRTTCSRTEHPVKNHWPSREGELSTDQLRRDEQSAGDEDEQVAPAIKMCSSGYQTKTGHKKNEVVRENSRQQELEWAWWHTTAILQFLNDSTIELATKKFEQDWMTNSTNISCRCSMEEATRAFRF